MPNIPYTNDTSREALEVQLECLRKMTPQQRIRQTCSMSQQIKRMAFEAIRRRHPDWSEQEIQLKFIELTYGTHLAADVRAWLKDRNIEQRG